MNILRLEQANNFEMKQFRISPPPLFPSVACSRATCTNISNLCLEINSKQSISIDVFLSFVKSVNVWNLDFNLNFKVTAKTLNY